MDIYADRRSAIRENFGIRTIRLRGEEIHPECRTDQEIMMAAMFSREAIGICDRCGIPLSEIPSRSNQ